MIVKILKTLCMPLALSLIAMVAGLVLARCKTSEKRSRVRIGRALLILTAFGLYLFSIHPVANMLVRPLESQYARPAPETLEDVDAVIVLSGGAFQANSLRPTPLPSGVGTARLLGGVKLFKACGARYLVITGAAPGRPLSEAAVMGRLAVELGVPTDRIVLEEKATNTYEHAPRVLERMPELRGMKVALVTSALHMPRAMQVFSRYFGRDRLVPYPAFWLYDSGPWTVRTFLPNADALAKSTVACVEYVGRLWYWVRPAPLAPATQPASRPTTQ